MSSANLPEILTLGPSWLRDAYVTRKGPELDQIWAWIRWLDRDNPETNPISKTPETVSHKEEQFFLTCCSLLEHHFPVKSFTSLVCVSSQKISFPSVSSSSSSSVRQEPTFRPLKGPLVRNWEASSTRRICVKRCGSAKPVTSCWLRCRRRHVSPGLGVLLPLLSKLCAIFVFLVPQRK